MKFINHYKNILSNPEGRIFAVGVISGVLFTCWLGLSHWWLPGKTPLLLTMTATDITLGRSAGMYLGFIANLNPVLVIAVNILVDTIWILLFYPLVIFSMRHFVMIKFLKKSVERILKAAESHRNKIQRYGVPGLFLFILIPIPMTGPVVGGVIGYLMKLRPAVNMCIALSATYVTIAIWAVLLRQVHKIAEAHNPATPIFLLGTFIIVGVIGRHLARKYRINNRLPREENLCNLDH